MLRAERLKKCLSQRQLSRISGVSQSYISKLEGSKFYHSPTLKQIIALSKALNIDPKLLANNLIDKELNSNFWQINDKIYLLIKNYRGEYILWVLKKNLQKIN